jgi:N-acetylglucosaminyldiphosphoundecaprenol N-acetyl-beta-D-mannosaminyltransferase
MTEEINILGVKVSNYNTTELLNKILEVINQVETGIMLSGNIHGLNLCQKHPWLKDFYNTADIVRNDSAGLLLAGKILGRPLKNRMTWADFGWDLGRFCEVNNLSLYFLGDKPGIAKQARNNMLLKLSNLNIVGVHHGYFKKSIQGNKEIIKLVNSSNPDILIVGFGMPLQEEWILKNKDSINAKIIMTCGNCFSYLAGIEKRAPSWMRKNGMEWLFRLYLDPKRMFNRYIFGNPMFIVRVIMEKIGIISYN